MFRKVLIANRGEIAVRIIRTCKRLGVRTVAVYSEPDGTSRHAYYADEAYSIGAGEPSESYLNIPRILETAKTAGVEAVHPGYGFLAENAEFAREVAEAGLVFIGPSARVLAGITSKLDGKNKVSDAGVPVTPGSRRMLESVDEANEEAARIGYPVLVKAAYGGGGRGMRVVHKASELPRMIEIARAEAKAGFGRSDLYLEKYLESPRHIEIQVISGQHGRMIHLGERECSMQRRYQKILEETPSPVVSPEERERICSLALKAARVFGYENAGTVEFVRSQSGDYYYMELNKRIQVEHLVTELVTGVDIVEQQLRIASGDGLDLSQEEIILRGWAINCRINAEDPEKGFVPSPGLVSRYVPPTPQWIRVDTALYDGWRIPQYYDSLIAKVASHASDRMRAIGWMKLALGEMIVEGVKTTIPVHQTIMEYPSFLRGDYHTQTLERMLAHWKPDSEASVEEVAAAYLAGKRTGPKILIEHPGQDGSTQSRWRNATRSRSPVNGRQPLYMEGF